MKKIFKRTFKVDGKTPLAGFFAFVFMTGICFSQTASLNSVCLDSSGPAIVSAIGALPAATQALDSMGYDFSKMTVKGTCDSVQILYPVTLGTFTMNMPIGSIVKKDSCSLKVNFATTDTTINLCAVSRVIPLSNVNRTAGSGSSFRIMMTNNQTVVSWNPEATAIQSFSLFDLSGRRIANIIVRKGQSSVALSGLRPAPYIVAARLADGRNLLQLAR